MEIDTLNTYIQYKSTPITHIYTIEIDTPNTYTIEIDTHNTYIQ
jgi:hypothetical protein